MRPNLFKLTLSSALIYAMSIMGSANSAEINVPGFTGTANHTVTSGLSMRISDYNCSLYTGYSYTETGISAGLTTASRGNGKGCAFNDAMPAWTDAYGNTASQYNNYMGTQPNADNGSLNFGRGDIFSAKQKIFGSITGTTDSGLGVDVSYSASYNPALSINSPRFKALTNGAESQFETDVTLYDAYVTGSADMPDGNFIDYQIGRFATNWGEATFIPVGANGLVTNALDLSKLRGPGASIREALMPTEQITISSQANGINVEMYYQFDSKEVQLDPSGTYFGSDFVGKGSGPIIVAGAYDYEAAGGNTCALSQQTLGVCDATALAASRSNDNHVLNMLNTGAGQLTAGQITTALTQFAATRFGSVQGDNDLGSDLVDNTILTAGSEALGIAAGSNTGASSETGFGSVIMYSAGAGFASSLAAEAAKTVNGSGQIAGVESFGAAQKHVYAEDGGEYGIRLGTYLDDVGTGVDLNFYYANYHSKQPYVRFTGAGNMFAGDYYALYRAVVTDNFGLYSGTALDALDGSLRSTTAGDTLYQAIQDTAYGGTICGAVLDRAVGGPTISALLGDATITRYTISQGQRALYMDRSFGTDLSASGEKALIHNSAVCQGTMNTIDTLTNGTANDVNLAAELTAAQVLGAITPLSAMTHQFIYPEDNQIVGASFSTNVGSTTVQGEISLRPDFPLATPASSQINQIADAAGTTQMLNWLAYAGLNGSGTNTSRGLANDATDTTGDTLQAVLWATRSGMDALLGGNAYDIAVRDFKRSSLPSISQATVTAGDYNSTPFLRYDVLTMDLGTTTSFTASDPITVGLGADSAAILTEIAMVQINELDNTRGYVARGGFAASGDDPSKCGGVTGGSLTNTPGLAGVQSLGASHVDALFGNGGYCEEKPGAEKLSLSYRVIGTATYNNFQNTRWALSPNFAFAHDPYGYGPSSLGGFVEDRMSLSLGVNATSGGTTVGFSYTNNLGDNDVGTTTDRDYITASVSHSF